MRLRGKTHGTAAGPRHLSSSSFLTDCRNSWASTARSAKVLSDLGHSVPQSIVSPSEVVEVPGVTESHPICMHVAAVAAKPSLTVFHEKSVAYEEMKASRQVLRSQHLGTHSSHKAEVIVTMAPVFIR